MSKHNSFFFPLPFILYSFRYFYHKNLKIAEHFKTKTHRNFIESYETYYKDADEFRKEIKDLKVENGLLKRKLQKCEEIIQIRELEISFLNGIGKSEEPDDEESYEDAIEGYT